MKARCLLFSSLFGLLLGCVSAPYVAKTNSEEEIKQVVVSNQPEVMNCYRMATRMDSEQQGKVEFSWNIGANGEAKNVQASSEKIKNPDALECMKKAFSKMKFAPASSKEQKELFQFYFDFSYREL